MAARLWLFADDYGIAPGVSRGIRELLTSGRLSGTGCMTLFPEWQEEAALLIAHSSDASLGIHLTLTDFAPLTGKSVLAPEGTLPPLARLIRMCLMPDAGLVSAVHAELDAQLAAFEAAIGRAPDFLDGHQHVHFLSPVRSWLAARQTSLAADGAGPWLRGAPSSALLPTIAMRAKVAAVAMLARGFDAAMRQAGYDVRGPLHGFYDWTDTGQFPDVIARLRDRAPEGAIVMCHPGEVDDLLLRRDGLTQARETELSTLAALAPFARREARA